MTASNGQATDGQTTDGTVTDATDGQASDESVWSVVLPVYDESVETVTRLVERLQSAHWEDVVVCVDRPEEAMRSALDDEAVTVSTRRYRRGKGGALIDGLSATTGDVVGYVDADGAVSIGDLERLYRVVEAGAPSMAVGSRQREATGRDGQSLLRRTLGHGYGRLASAFVGAPVEDLQCGAKAFSRSVWHAVADHLRETGFAFDTELVVRAHRAGFPVREIPIEWSDPGRSSVVPSRDVPRMVGSLVRIRRRLDAASGREGDHATATPSPDDDTLSLALVTAHPPETGHLAEYGGHLARAYAARSDVDLTVLAPRSDTVQSERPPESTPYEVRRVWTRDSIRGAAALLRAIRNGGFDAVQFNIHMTYFGERNAYRALGLALPPVARLAGPTVVTTLHDMLDIVAEGELDQDVGRLERLGARAATQAVLLSDATTVTSAAFRDTIESAYLAPRVYHVPHGTFGEGGQNAQADAAADGPTPAAGVADGGPFQVLVFGHLGPTKDVATVVDAVERLRGDGEGVELVVAGDAHPQHPEHRQRLQDRFGDRSYVRFTGYVPESDLADVFTSASVLVLPYTTCTGVSGVFQMAKRYGVPTVAFDADGMRTATVETGGEATFVPVGDTAALTDELADLLDSPERRRTLARRNAAAGADCSIDDVAAQFLDVFREVRG